MINAHLVELFRRDLAKLSDEINLYESEEAIWRLDSQIANSAGTLCLHLIGNLNAYIGAVLGNTGYIRNRALEFEQRNIPSEQLLDAIDKTAEMIEQVLSSISTSELEAEFPIQVFGYSMKTDFFLIHLFGHLSYHLGQINYHRRLVGSST